MAALTSLVPDVQAEIPELPSFIAERQLLRAAREFCEQSRTWRADATLSVSANTPTLTLTGFLPAGTELVDVISIKNTGGGAPLVPRTYAWLDENTTDWRGDTSEDAKWYVLDGNNTIRFIPTPTSTQVDKYYIRVAVKPKLTATTLNDVLVNKYDEVLISGALARLYMIPRKPWTDLNLGQYHRGMFMSGWNAARAEATDEFQTGVPRKVKYGGL